jgi:thiol-disulfide isomerase/thioredoxin
MYLSMICEWQNWLRPMALMRPELEFYLFWKTFRKFGAVFFAVAALTSSPWVQAQGYEILPWPANKPVPALEGFDLTGHAWHLASLRGKAVLINFWASWCAPCLAEMPSLQTMGELYGPGNVVVLAVNFKESSTVVQRYAQRTNLNLPVLLDPAGTMARAWGTTVFPTTVLVAADGRVAGVVRGEFDWTGTQAAKLLEPLMAPLDQRDEKSVRR